MGKELTVLQETTIRKINIRKMGLTHVQLSSVLPEKPDRTLYIYETSIKGKYTGYHLSDEEGNFGLVCCFASLSTAMVMLGGSVYLTTLLSLASLNKLLPVFF